MSFHPTTDNFTFNLSHAPHCFDCPTLKQKDILSTNFNSLVRQYKKHMRLHKNNTPHNYILPTCVGALTCGQIAMLMLRYRAAQRTNLDQNNV